MNSIIYSFFYLEETIAIFLAVNDDGGPERDLKNCNGR